MRDTTRRDPNRNLLLKTAPLSPEVPQAQVRESRGFRQLWDVKQLAEYLGVDKSWVYERTRENGPEGIPHFKLGKYLRFDPNSELFRAWLKSHEVTPSSPLEDSGGSNTNQEIKAHLGYTEGRLSGRASHKRKEENE